MKNYRVNVNGTNYEIAIEEITGAAAQAAPAPVKESAPAPVKEAAPAPAATPVAAAPAGGESVNSPMPGTILAVNVKVGDSVKSGDVLMILEAMKMENEIMSPVDGTVTAVAVNQGVSIETGALLCTIA